MLSARVGAHDRRSGPPFALALHLGLMTRESVYAFFLRLYPEASQRQYGEEMLQTFRALSRDSQV